MARLPLNLHSYEHGGVAAPRFTLVAPARMLLPFIRYPLGYEVVHPKAQVIRLVVLALLPPIFWVLWGMLTGTAPPENEGHEFVLLYVAAVFLVSCLRFMRRAWGQHRGEEIHTAEAGYSFVARWLPLPVALSEQVIVPVLLFFIGKLLVETISVDLGFWFEISAVSYFLLANWERRNQLAQRRAPVDDKLRAQGFVEDIDTHEQRASRRSASPKGTASSPYPGDAPPDIAELGGGRRK